MVNRAMEKSPCLQEVMVASTQRAWQESFSTCVIIKKKLGLTDAQIQTMKGLDFEFKKKRIQAKADHEIAHMELELHVHSGKVDEAKIRAAGAKIVAAKSNKIMAMIEAKIQLLKLVDHRTKTENGQDALG